MTLTELAFLIILITLPFSFLVVKTISYTYEAKDAKLQALNKDAKLSAHK